MGSGHIVQAHALHGTYRPGDETFQKKLKGTVHTGSLRHGIVFYISNLYEGEYRPVYFVAYVKWQVFFH